MIGRAGEHGLRATPERQAAGRSSRSSAIRARSSVICLLKAGALLPRLCFEQAADQGGGIDSFDVFSASISVNGWRAAIICRACSS